jgi:hypothetical protein
LTQAQTLYDQWLASVDGYAGFVLNIDLKGPALHVLLAQLDPASFAKYDKNARQFFDQYLNQAGIQHTQRGLAYPYHYGAARPAANAAFLALAYSQQLRSTNGDAAYAARLFNYAQYQVDYILGKYASSLMIGVGSDYPKFLWHKWSYNAYIDWPTRGQYQVMSPVIGPWTVSKTARPVVVQAAKLDIEGSRNPQRFIAYGALYGAPLQDDSIVSGRKDYTYTEPTTEGQGGITGALAGLVQYFSAGISPVTDCNLDLGWGHPNATVAPKGRPPSCGSTSASG